MEIRATPAISIYMPTHPVEEIEQDPTRLKNLLNAAEEQAVEHGLRLTEARDLLAPARKLLNDLHFWQHQGNGLVIFASAELFLYYRLPLEFQELQTVGERFHIKPLLPLFNEDGLFHILAISQNKVRLLQCTRYFFKDVTPDSVPSSLSEALKYDEPEKQLQFHTVGQGPAIFHGQGVSKDYDKNAILRYFQQVDRGLHDLMKEQRAPLILAAVDYLHSIYREANTYGKLLDEGLNGNYDESSDADLHNEAWDIAGTYFDRYRLEAIERYHEATGKGFTTTDVKEVVQAAFDGRVDTLFAARDVQKWGRFDPVNRKVTLGENKGTGSEDLIDLAAIHTLSRNGAVYILDGQSMPEMAPIAALLRF